jgi:hypothetical protein
MSISIFSRQESLIEITLTCQKSRSRGRIIMRHKMKLCSLGLPIASERLEGDLGADHFSISEDAMFRLAMDEFVRVV